MMQAKPMFDLSAKTAEELRQNFEIKVLNSNVLFWEKSSKTEREADISLPKFLFTTEVLEKPERSNSVVSH